MEICNPLKYKMDNSILIIPNYVWDNPSEWQGVFEPEYDKTNIFTCAPSEDLDQSGIQRICYVLYELILCNFVINGPIMWIKTVDPN